MTLPLSPAAAARVRAALAAACVNAFAGLSLEEARARNVCRLCGGDVHPLPFKYDFGTEHAHWICLAQDQIRAALAEVDAALAAPPLDLSAALRALTEAGSRLWRCEACAYGVPFTDTAGQWEHEAADGFCEVPFPCRRRVMEGPDGADMKRAVADARAAAALLAEAERRDGGA